MAGKGILLGENGDLLIKNKSVVVGDTEMQEVAIILQLNQGELKLYPLLGPNLIQLQKTNSSKFLIEQRLRLNLARDGKNYDDIKNKVQAIWQ